MTFYTIIANVHYIFVTTTTISDIDSFRNPFLFFEHVKNNFEKYGMKCYFSFKV